MKRLLLKISNLKKRLTAELGHFILFGLFKREGTPGTWDLVVSAPWLDEEQTTGRSLLFRRLRKALGPKDVLKLSRVVVLRPNDEFLRTLDAVDVEDGTLMVLGDLTVGGMVDVTDSWVDMRGCELNGMALEHAVLFANHPGYRDQGATRALRRRRGRAAPRREEAVGTSTPHGP